MEHVLYATDCSEHSKNALKYVLGFVRQIDARLTLLHVYNLPPIDNISIRSPEHFRRSSSMEHLELLKNYFTKHRLSEDLSPEIDFIVAESNSISSGIEEKSNSLSADLVIVGRKDEHSLRGILAGNIASRLLSRLSTPLLVLPNTIDQKEFKTVVYATDFEADDILAITYLQEMLARLQVSLKVVHIPTMNEYSGSQQMEWFKEMVVQKTGGENIDFQMVLSDQISQGLRVFLEESEADLLAMLERDEKGYIHKLIHGDQVIKMKSLSTIPLMCFNRKCFN